MDQPLTELQEISLALAKLKASLDKQSESISNAKIALLGCTEPTKKERESYPRLVDSPVLFRVCGMR